MSELGQRLRIARLQAGIKTQSAAAERCGWGADNQSRIGNYETGYREPRLDEIRAMADAYNVNFSWLATGEGSMEAGIAEHRLAYRSNVEPGPEIRGSVPLISWVQAGDWCEANDPYPPGMAESMEPCPRNHGPHTYALRVRGPSMEPRFREGEIIFIDPDAQVDSGHFVIAKRAGGDATFKQLVIEGQDRYLKAINTAWPEPIIRVDGEWHICGRVICKTEIF